MIRQSDNFTAPVNEVFFSYQGEGVYAGQAQIFVRFALCNLRCNYCDTAKALTKNTNTKYYTSDALYELIYGTYLKNKKNFFGSTPEVSFTGGEPLLYAEFMLPLLKKLKAVKFKIYLETNGTLTDNLKKIYKFCDTVAADIKFKSACGKNLYNGHKEFIKTCKDKVFVKTVITEQTTPAEFTKALNIILSVSKNIKLIIQPSASTKQLNKKVFMFYAEATNKLNDVRILPQLHKIWNID